MQSTYVSKSRGWLLRAKESHHREQCKSVSRTHSATAVRVIAPRAHTRRIQSEDVARKLRNGAINFLAASQRLAINSAAAAEESAPRATSPRAQIWHCVCALRRLRDLRRKIACAPPIYQLRALTTMSRRIIQGPSQILLFVAAFYLICVLFCGWAWVDAACYGLSLM